MARLEIKLNEYERKRIESVKNDKSRKSKVRIKATVILDKADRKSNDVIMQETGLSKRTIIYYVNDYLEKGISSIHYPGNYKKSVLSQFTKLFDRFREDPPTTYKEATELIRKEYNVNISESATRRHLNRIGIYTEHSTKRRKRKR